jgi:hypothetical protein
VDDLVQLLAEQYPGRPVLRMSAKTGAGFEALCEVLDQRGQFATRMMEVDYDIYAEGEAELGWLNSSMVVKSAQPFALDALLTDIISRLRSSLEEIGAETAHLKTIGLWEGFYGVANLVSSSSQPELSLPSKCQVREANVVVNARVATDPEVLKQHVDQAVARSCAALGAQASGQQTQSFRPGRPVPTHRILQAAV